MKLDRDPPSRNWFARALRRGRAQQFASQTVTGMARLADLCDRTALPSREIDICIARAISSDVRLPAAAVLETRSNLDELRIGVPRYSSAAVAAMTLVPDGYRINFNPRANGRIEILRHGDARVIGWGVNQHFPLAACAAALRALVTLAADRSRNFGGHMASACENVEERGEAPCRS